MRTAVRFVVGVGLLGLVVFSAGASGQAPRPWPSAANDLTVTPVDGPGWLTRLGVTLSQTSLGRGSGRYGPPERTAVPSPSLGVPAHVALTGADLYRFNCQACHGLEGRGAPPEIKSAVDSVRGVPLDLLRAQMKAQHQPPGEAEARARPERVRAAILTRVHNGGQRMPSREHLSDGELDLLFGYLGVLAASPKAGRVKHETVSWARVGQHVVKGTCHICHDAVGPRPSDAAMVQGKIPSLQSLLVSQSVAEFVTKARSGAPVQLSELGMLHRGRMPAFYYLRDEEIAAAYVYLATYPPAGATAH
jgi:mono/diheme cytochrome c family protein